MPRTARTSSRADQVMFVTCVLLAFGALVAPARTRSTIAGALRGSIVVPLSSLQARTETVRHAVLTYDASLRVADSLRLLTRYGAAAVAENEQLRRLLGLGAALRWGFVPAEALRGRGIGDDFTLTLGAGRSEGVERFSAVVAPDGLVGMIESVDVHSSVAIVWPHPDFRVSGMSADGAAFGIVYPHLGAGGARFLLELRGVAFRNELRPGTLIVSSGLGGVYPKGIPIGSVVSELKTTEAWARSYLLVPSVRPVDATTVLVVQPQRARQGVSDAWQHAVDDALRLIVTASDSLAALRADSLARLERRRLDSLQAVPPRDDSAAIAPPLRGNGEASRPTPTSPRAVKPPRSRQ